MTTITVYTSADGAVRGFLASGHAGGKKIRGYDLVCCAVSALTQTCLLYTSCVHAGFHMLPLVCKLQKRPAWRKITVAWSLIAVCGAYALVKRQLPGYMFMQIQFAFFDYDEPLVFFLLDYLTIMMLFASMGVVLQNFLGRKKKA